MTIVNLAAIVFLRQQSSLDQTNLNQGTSPECLRQRQVKHHYCQAIAEQLMRPSAAHTLFSLLRMQ
jgi:hypothetical protein